MAKRRKFRGLPTKHNPVNRQSTKVHVLEMGSLQDMRDAKARTSAMLKYHWDYYSELARQRNEIQDEVKKTLNEACITNFSFKQWQRAVKWKYGLHPLSAVGSSTYVGQRFNTGSEVNSEVPSFSALYIAQNKDTALQETLGQSDNSKCPLKGIELALTNPQSEVIVSVSGQLEKVFDLRSHEKLKKFANLIKDFKLSAALNSTAIKLNLPKPELIRDPKKLLETFLLAEWRVNPVSFDVPANSQIFGHLISQAGIEGILYPSKFTKDDCLAIFPHNLASTSSFIQYDDEPPHEKIPKRIDSTNWRICELTPKELIG